MNCYHCNQTITDEVKGRVDSDNGIDNKEQSFCCHGCLTVCKIIKSNNLDNFYEQNITNSSNKRPIFTNQYPLEYYDLPDFTDEFVIDNRITLVSPNIHCAACVWLIEKTIGKMPGVELVRGNLSNQRIIIKLKENAKLSKVIEKLAILGYGSEPLIENSQEILRKQQNRSMLGKIGFAAFAMMNLLWISISLYTGADNGKYNEYFLWLSFAIATPTLFYSGSTILKSSWNGLKNKHLNMDTPISIGALTTYFYSSFVLFGAVDGDVYFDTVVNFIFVILIGRYLEASVKKSALSDASGFESITPKVATLLKNGIEKITAINSLKKGDEIIVKTGERIGVDGKIISGNLEIDESIITGEALPVNKKTGDIVFAGTLNNSGTATILVEKVKNSTIKQIKQMVEDASFAKPSIECTIDKFIPYFVITTISLAILSFIFNLNSGFDTALLTGVSVLIITCPCAFGIAVPIVNSISGSLLLKNKIIVKNSDILERLLKVQTVIFDKTGTLTTGDFLIEKLVAKDKEKALQIIASISKLSNHPISKSIVKNYQGVFIDVENFEQISGSGIIGKIDKDAYKIGNYEFAGGNSAEKNANIYVSKNDVNIASIFLKDEVNNNAKIVVKFLQKLGKKVIILSGDNQTSVKNIANNLAVDEFYHSQKPTDKIEFVENLQKQKNVLMIGDGVNDAPALSLASCSLAIAGIDIASEKADAVIHKNNLNAIIKLYKVATLSKKIILQNIIFALGYNLIFIPLAFFGLITPLMAAIVMPISSIIVILNSIRIKKLELKN
jgi:Cu2+-exporting ATPase